MVFVGLLSSGSPMMSRDGAKQAEIFNQVILRDTLMIYSEYSTMRTTPRRTDGVGGIQLWADRERTCDGR
jgi:hypothetical protein